MPQSTRDQVFISYCHDDNEWLKKLQTMLKPLVRNKNISVWDDTQIKPGANWKENIEGALAAAKVAVLLVSPNFLASDFIAEHELPPLLEAAEKDGLIILWVYVSSCLYDETEIQKYQAAHDIARPLDRLTPAEQGNVLAAICKKVKAAVTLGGSPLTCAGPPEETPPADKLDRLPGYMPQKTGSHALGGSQSASADDSLIIRDNRLRDPNPPILEIIPYKETPTVDKLLDRIWNSLLPRPRPYSYGREWILYAKGEYFHKVGTRWAQFIERKQLDERPLREVGIIPNMILEVHPPKQRFVVINQRPLVGGGEEPLLLEYFGLKTVSGLLNRIQNSIPDFSVESYGSKWILYDPATGRYFDDIVKGDSRVLEAAGIATDDGDTFLDVRPPQHREQPKPWLLAIAAIITIATVTVLLLNFLWQPAPRLSPTIGQGSAQSPVQSATPLSQRISGIVADESDSPVEGAKVVMIGSSTSTATGPDGSFSLEVHSAEELAHLSITKDGFHPLSEYYPVRRDVRVVLHRQ
jgi:hypothetical protein